MDSINQKLELLINNKLEQLCMELNNEETNKEYLMRELDNLEKNELVKLFNMICMNNKINIRTLCKNNRIQHRTVNSWITGDSDNLTVRSIITDWMINGLCSTPIDMSKIIKKIPDLISRIYEIDTRRPIRHAVIIDGDQYPKIQNSYITLFKESRENGVQFIYVVRDDTKIMTKSGESKLIIDDNEDIIVSTYVNTSHLSTILKINIVASTLITKFPNMYIMLLIDNKNIDELLMNLHDMGKCEHASNCTELATLLRQL